MTRYFSTCNWIEKSYVSCVDICLCVCVWHFNVSSFFAEFWTMSESQERFLMVISLSCRPHVDLAGSQCSQSFPRVTFLALYCPCKGCNLRNIKWALATGKVFTRSTSRRNKHLKSLFSPNLGIGLTFCTPIRSGLIQI